MAEAEKKDEKDTGGAEQAAKKSGKGKLLLAAGGVLVLLILIGVPVVVISMQEPKKSGAEELPIDAALIDQEDHAPVEAHSYTEEELEDGEEALGAIFPLETFVVNLSKGRFVRVQMQLEFSERDVPGRFYSRIVPVRDALILLLTARTADDLSTPEGLELLKADVKSKINEVLRKELVKSVYFTQFVVQ